MKKNTAQAKTDKPVYRTLNVRLTSNLSVHNFKTKDGVAGVLGKFKCQSPDGNYELVLFDTALERAKGLTVDWETFELVKGTPLAKDDFIQINGRYEYETEYDKHKLTTFDAGRIHLKGHLGQKEATEATSKATKATKTRRAI